MMKLKNKVLYVSLYSLLKKKFKKGQLVSMNVMKCELGKHFLVPKNMKDYAINELIRMRILKKTDNKLEVLTNNSFEQDIANSKA